MYSYTEPREAVLNYDRWLLSGKDGWQEATVAEGQRHSKTVIVRINGYDDRDQASKLIGTEIGVPRDELPKATDHQFYWLDLEGLRVVHRDGTELGKVDHLLEVVGAAAQGDLTKTVTIEGNEAVDELAAGSEEMASSSEELGAQATGLRDLVSRFKTSNSQVEQTATV